MDKSVAKDDPLQHLNLLATLSFLETSRGGIRAEKKFTKNLENLRNIGKKVHFPKIPPQKT